MKTAAWLLQTSCDRLARCAGALNPNFIEGPFSLDFGSLRALK